MAKNDEKAPLEHLDVESRAKIGREARQRAPRTSHAAWKVTPERVPPDEVLAKQEVTRVPDLVPIRHERMMASPFAFYRGAAAVMADDLGTMPHSGLLVQACGDAHLANFGGFASPERDLVFDINDFDETNPGPFEWDVKRLAASIEIACRSREFAEKDVRAATRASVQSYREAMGVFAAVSNLDVWYSRLDAQMLRDRIKEVGSGFSAKRMNRTIAKAEQRDSMRALTKLTQRIDGELRIKSDPPLIISITDVAEENDTDAQPLIAWLHDQFRVYRRSLQPDRRRLLEGYRLVDLARKVVGVGSVGTRCWVALLLGRDENDPLFLQIKEAEASVLEPHCGKSGYANHAQRVVEGQRMLQASSDILLGWMRVVGLDGIERDYYVRQLWDWKVSAAIETMLPPALLAYAQICGWSLARGHARSGDRVAIASYLGNSDRFDRAIDEFAVAYADQNERDYETVRSALAPTLASLSSPQ